MNNSGSEKTAYPWCHNQVSSVSRSFAVTIDILEEPMSSYIAVGYLLCRIPDTIEDDGTLHSHCKVNLLREYVRTVDPSAEQSGVEFEDTVHTAVPDKQSDEWSVVYNTQTVITAFESFPPEVQQTMRPHIIELVEGLIQYISRGNTNGVRIKSRDDLETYCYYVAGTVGLVITDLCVLDSDIPDSETLRTQAVQFGELLQLVNILKDVHEDYTRENSVFVPAEMLQEEDVSQDQLLQPEFRQQSRRVLNRLINRAFEKSYPSHEWLETIKSHRPHSEYTAWALPYLLALGTLREIDKDTTAPLSDETVKVSRDEVFSLCATLSEDAEDLDTLRETVLQAS